MCAFARAPSPRMLRRTALFADSARRKASSRSSAISIVSPRAVGPRAGRIAPPQFHPRRSRRPPPARSSTKKSTWMRCSIAPSRQATITPSARVSRRENPRTRPSSAASALPPFLHGAGFTGSGEDYLASDSGRWKRRRKASCAFSPAARKSGQGTNTIFSQIAADALGLDCDRSKLLSPTRRTCPNSGPTVASRTTMIVGNLVESAALGIKQQLARQRLACEARIRGAEFAHACRALHRKARAAAVRWPSMSQPPGLLWDDEKYQGDAYGAYGLGRVRRRSLRGHASRPRRASTISSPCRKSEK